LVLLCLLHLHSARTGEIAVTGGGKRRLASALEREFREEMKEERARRYELLSMVSSTRATTSIVPERPAYFERASRASVLEN
jgi:hypothetical protein